LRQNGNNNAYGIFQYGRNAGTDVVQDGDNGSGATFSYGW
jgi:major curlin subunit